MQLSLAEAKLTRTLQEEAQAESRLRRAQEERERVGAELAFAADLRGADLGIAAGYARFASKQCESLCDAWQQSKRVSREQAAMHSAAKRRFKLLERLRERRRAEWQTKMGRELDDFALESYLGRYRSED